MRHWPLACTGVDELMLLSAKTGPLVSRMAQCIILRCPVVAGTAFADNFYQLTNALKEVHLSAGGVSLQGARMPIEPTMFLTIGFLLTSLIGVAVIPLVHRRAVRLTTRRLKAALPQLTGETQADKDLLRAEFAMAPRGLESTVERLRSKITDQGIELARKEDAINRLRIERDALNIKIAALEMQAAVAARSASMGEPASLAGATQFSPEQREDQAMQADTWPECEGQSTQEDSFARDEDTRHASIVPAMSQSAEDTWTRDHGDSGPIGEPDPANSRLATALSLNVPRSDKTSA